MFKRRVGGVYFAIITQAVALILSDLIIGQQGYTGGVNGITDLKTLLGWDIRTDSAKYDPVLTSTRVCCSAPSCLCRYMLSSKLGMLLLAMRDKEDRVRFSGYDVANFKIFVSVSRRCFPPSAARMFTLQVGFMSPSFVGIVPSIEMVIFAAVGGRMSLVGAVYGALLVNFGKTYFSESFPDLWLFLMAALFIGVVMVFPNGLAGLYESFAKRRRRRRCEHGQADTADPVNTADPQACSGQVPLAASRRSGRGRGSDAKLKRAHAKQRFNPLGRRADRLVRRLQGHR